MVRVIVIQYTYHEFYRPSTRALIPHVCSKTFQSMMGSLPQENQSIWGINYNYPVASNHIPFCSYNYP